MNITATIITLNEEKHIVDCIRSVRQVCDEVIVLDSLSTDRTRELAKQEGARVIEQSYLGDGPQKACAASYASNNWVLSFDADERLDERMLEAIRALDLENAHFDRYAFNRKTYVGSKWIKVWYPDYVIRLYNRQKSAYQPVMLHSEVEGGRLGRLPGDILHFSFEDYLDLAQTTVKYANQSVDILVSKQKRIGPLSPFIHAAGAFLRKYIGKKGVLYGEAGLTISIMTAWGTYLKYQVARKRMLGKNNEPE